MLGKALEAARQDRVEVGEEHHRHTQRVPAARNEIEHSRQTGTVGQGSRRGPLIDRTVGYRIAERHAQLDQIGSAGH